ncbi:major facilitator superfamily domain-containing protein [Gorgonomyces haynaldii]|nr:major facilitator superfamily domain-containing protein [Gorgonomyces haynaldii]
MSAKLREHSVTPSVESSSRDRVRPKPLKSKLYHVVDERTVLRRTSSFGGGPLVVTQKTLEPVDGPIRWVVLFLACLLLFGNYYAYDNPAALNVPLQQFLGHDYDTWQFELNMLYSVYSFPNMFLPMLGGHLVDRYDPKRVLTAFSVLVVLGQALYSTGVSLKLFPLMIFGRILFGIGGESISVVQSSITTSFFKGKELSFALGMNLCIARLGSVVNSILSPRLALMFNTPLAVWFATLSCFLSFLCGIILVNIISHHEQKRDLETQEQTEPLLQEQEQTQTSVSFGPIQHLPLSFWILCLVCILLYGCVVPFNAIASDFLMSKWYHGDTVMAGFVMSIPDFLSAFLVPLFGTLVDYIGLRISFLFVCCACIFGAHLTLGLTENGPIPSFVFLGLSYAIYGVVIWPSVATVAQHQEALLEKEGKQIKLLGTAFGFSTAALNTALTLLPLIAAFIRVLTGSFVYLELFFCGMAALAFICCIVLYFDDKKNDNVLQIVAESPSEDNPDFGDLVQSPTNSPQRQWLGDMSVDTVSIHSRRSSITSVAQPQTKSMLHSVGLLTSRMNITPSTQAESAVLDHQREPSID